MSSHSGFPCGTSLGAPPLAPLAQRVQGDVGLRDARARREYDGAMAHIEDDGRSGGEPIRPAPQDPPLQALLPGLDRLTASSFRKGTVSRRRINRAILLLVAVAGVTAALITASVVL